MIAAFNHHREERSVPEVPVPESVPEPSSAGEKKKVQDLELDEELRGWIEGVGGGAVSMLNLLAFRPGMRARYLEYGKAFAEDVGKKWGGRAKLVGKVVDGDEEGRWDEVCFFLFFFPSLFLSSPSLILSPHSFIHKEKKQTWAVLISMKFFFG